MSSAWCLPVRRSIGITNRRGEVGASAEPVCRDDRCRQTQNGLRMRSKQRGVTILELLVVLAILGLLVTIAYTVYSGHIFRAKITAAVTQIHELELACAQYEVDTGQYPPSSSGSRLAPGPIDPIASAAIPTVPLICAGRGLISSWNPRSSAQSWANRSIRNSRFKCPRFSCSTPGECPTTMCEAWTTRPLVEPSCRAQVPSPAKSGIILPRFRSFRSVRTRLPRHGPRWAWKMTTSRISAIEPMRRASF